MICFESTSFWRQDLAYGSLKYCSQVSAPAIYFLLQMAARALISADHLHTGEAQTHHIEGDLYSLQSS